MESKEYKELEAMLVVIYKKISDIEDELCKKRSRSASLNSYLKELKKEAEKLREE